MRLLAVAGSVVVAVVVIGGAVVLGSDGVSSFAASDSVASGSRAPVTRCHEAALGRSLQPKRGRELILGPVAFAGLVKRNGQLVADARTDFERKPGKRYTRFKSGAIVKRAVRATIAVPRSERPKLKLAYALGAGPGYRVVLKACPDRRTGFPGGFRVRGPLCTKLRVRVEGRSRPITKPVSFGAGECLAG